MGFVNVCLDNSIGRDVVFASYNLFLFFADVRMKKRASGKGQV